LFTKTFGQNCIIPEIKKHGGVDLCRYLWCYYNWKAIYWNPDVVHPHDGNQDHVTIYITAATKNVYHYLDIPLGVLVVQYNPTPKSPNVTDYREKLPKEALKKIPNEQEAENRLKILERVKFAFVTAEAGVHSALLLSGKIYEAHWATPPGRPNLYTISDFRSWKPTEGKLWCSGLIMIPPGEWERAQ